jgi:hypothetical protein
MSGIRGIGSQIKSDFQEIRDNAGKPRDQQTQAYRDKTEATRLKHNKAVDRMKKRRKKRRARREAAEAVTPEVIQPEQQTNQAMLNRMRMQQEQAARAANMDRARMMFERRNMMSPGPVPRQMQGLGGFRRQLPPGMSERMMRPAVMSPQFPENRMPGYGGQGTPPTSAPTQFPENRMPGYGGQGVMRPAVMPRYPQPMPRNQASSPAFRYAAQNYDRLGGMQRTMPRPMEMMSRGERQQIGRIADSFQPQPMQNPYVGILQRGISAKGGGRTMPQRPPMSGKGGGRTGVQMPRPMPSDPRISPFASMLASRFGGMR